MSGDGEVQDIYQNSESLTLWLERSFTFFINCSKPCIPSEDHKASLPPALSGADWPKALQSSGAESAAGTAGCPELS